jgi:sugar transferase EpsL
LIYSLFGKRAVDLVLGVTILVLALPILLLLSCVIFVDSGRPILFKQTRIGMNSVPFTMLKFKTMLENYDDSGVLLPTSERITLVGRVFRKTSLDELPGLINVIRGDMSLVGPRPLLVEYLERFTDRQSLRHIVRPGITGLSQVNGRNVLGWSEKLELDVQYAERSNFLLDISILWRTLKVVMSGSGVDVNGGSEMPNFRSE